MTSSSRYPVDHFITDLGNGQASAIVDRGVVTGPDGFTPDDRIGQATVKIYGLTSFRVLPVAGAGTVIEVTGPIANVRNLVRHTIR